MRIEISPSSLPHDAMVVRNTVFVEEQGFVDEYDEIDKIAIHFVMYDKDFPVATCRVFSKDSSTEFYLGRFAVMKAHRGQRIGAALMSAVEDYVRHIGGERLLLHAQLAASGFYASVGYTPIGEADEEQGCPHLWMEKRLN